LSKNYCAELKLPVSLISHGGRSDIDNHLETKKHKSSVEAEMSSSPVTHFQSCSFWWGSAVSSEGSYFCVSRCHLRAAF